jgi:hypothetical protein
VILIKIGFVAQRGGCSIVCNKQPHLNTCENCYLLLNSLSEILLLVVLVSKREVISKNCYVLLNFLSKILVLVVLVFKPRAISV